MLKTSIEQEKIRILTFQNMVASYSQLFREFTTLDPVHNTHSTDPRNIINSESCNKTYLFSVMKDQIFELTLIHAHISILAKSDDKQITTNLLRFIFILDTTSHINYKSVFMPMTILNTFFHLSKLRHSRYQFSYCELINDQNVRGGCAVI